MKNLFFLFLFCPVFCFAQTTHTVAPKESLYSLGRKYNVHPKDLAAYNHISLEAGLTVGQQLKIPPKSAAAPMPELKPEPVAEKQKAKTTPQTGSTPIYHKVAKKESLFRISKMYNATVDQIKSWNHLTGDGLTEGMSLVVGYGVPVEGTSSASIPPAVEEKKPVPEPVKEKPVAATVSTPVVTIIEDKKPVVEDKKAVVEEKKPVVEEKKPVVEDRKPAVASTPATVKSTGKGFNGGFFRSLYEDQAQKKSMMEQSGTAAIFKSSSGWEDGKYYCLHNSAVPGSIVKITNKANQRSVYAKVLDVIPDLKQNAGIMIRLSNAAADELGAGEQNFESIVSY